MSGARVRREVTSWVSLSTVDFALRLAKALGLSLSRRMERKRTGGLVESNERPEGGHEGKRSKEERDTLTPTYAEPPAPLRGHRRGPCRASRKTQMICVRPCQRASSPPPP